MPRSASKSAHLCRICIQNLQNYAQSYIIKHNYKESMIMNISYVHSLMSYEELCATINPHTNWRSRKIKQYSKTFVQLQVNRNSWNTMFNYYSSLDCNVWYSFCLLSYSRLCYTGIAFSFYDVIIVPKKFQSRQTIQQRQRR